ncbi:PspC domain-containing protein [Jeotgalibacillus soli]|uniref:PspC domain protein n=1 Tax=Jeotgalibacillus soli TaxID=889306 RepID=A0A0C2SD47_9BACL|nr:PspC domain-containing protein [Jeotgalibacillus soli]KIL51889.1 PspC domain protein [Jeotgalibacillus soli]
MAKRLYKDPNDKMIDGVCSGIAEYFNVDVAIVRVIFVLTAFLGGPGIIVYIALLIAMKNPPE